MPFEGLTTLWPWRLKSVCTDLSVAMTVCSIPVCPDEKSNIGIPFSTFHLYEPGMLTISLFSNSTIFCTSFTETALQSIKVPLALFSASVAIRGAVEYLTTQVSAQ